MKKLLIVLICSLLLFSACSSPKVINGVKYDTYGLINQDENKNPNIKYKVVWGNVIWGAILVETVVAPIYFFGFDLFEPVGVKTDIPGEIK